MGVDADADAVYIPLAQDGKLNDKGLPSLLQLAVMVPYFGDEIRTPSPPWDVQKAIFGLLAAIGRMLGYRPEYPYSHGSTRALVRREEARPPATREAISGGWPPRDNRAAPEAPTSPTPGRKIARSPVALSTAGYCPSDRKTDSRSNPIEELGERTYTHFASGASEE